MPSGASMGIGSIRGHWEAPRGCRGHQGSIRDVGVSGDVRGALGGWQGV